MSDIREPNRHAENVGKYTCTRCAWRWTPRRNSPDPPHACARCRSAYWQSTPVSSRGNSPSDPKWRAESQSVARRRQKRHLTRLKELAAEFGFALSPIRDDLSFAPPVFPLPQGSSQPVSRGYISTSPFHPAKIPSLRREDPWSRSCVAAWQPTQMPPPQNDHSGRGAAISRVIARSIGIYRISRPRPSAAVRSDGNKRPGRYETPIFAASNQVFEL